MSFIGDLFNSSSRDPGRAVIMEPSNVGQANQLYGQVQGGLTQQQNFANAAMQASPDIFAQQQQLSNMLMQQSQGQGPNPALAQLNNTTGQNVQQQAALMASQRGAGANTGLMARQASMQGGNIQQQAAGQAAVMQAQQQLAAQSMLGQQQSQIAGQQQNALSGYNQAAQGAQGQTLNSINGINSANLGSQQSVNQGNSSMYGNAVQMGAGIIGGAGAAMGQGGKGKAHGGMIEKYANGGAVSNLGQRMKAGGSVPGEAKVAGDNLKNDTVSAKLSPGEIVIPRSIVNSPGAPEKAAEFVRQVLAGKGKK